MGNDTKQANSKKQQVGFFHEDNGNRSSMRLMSFAAFIASFIFGLITIIYGDAGAEGIYITFGFLLSAFAPKALQKFAETSISPKGFDGNEIQQ